VLYIRPSQYQAQKKRYEELIAKIKQAGKRLFVGARFDDVPMSFDEYGRL